MDSGLTPVRDNKPNSENELKKMDTEFKNMILETNFCDKINETYTTNMSKKKVSFSEQNTVIKYEKKGNVKVMFLIGENDTLIRKIVNDPLRNANKKIKIKSILMKRKDEINTPTSTNSNANLISFRKKSIPIPVNNVKSRFLDFNYNSSRNKKVAVTLNVNKINKNHSLILIPKTNKFSKMISNF